MPATALLLAACGGQVSARSSSQTGAADAGGNLGTGGSATIHLGATGGAASAASPDASALPTLCGSTGSGKMEIPLKDFYVVLDASTGMSSLVAGVDGGGSYWDVARQGLEAFAQSPVSAGERVALSYSPPNGEQNCSATYGGPTVGFTDVPYGSASLVRSLEVHAPGGVSSLDLALKEAIFQAQTHSPSPEHMRIVVLVTSGAPSVCLPSEVAELSAIAKVGSDGAPRVWTAVIGIGDIDPAFDGVANAGLTGAAIRIPVAPTGGPSTDPFVKAMLTLSDLEGCTFPVPPATTPALDPAGLTVILTPKATAVPEWLPKLGGPTDCAINGDQGWYFDDLRNPSTILLCRSTCGRVATGSIQIAYGCWSGDPVR